MQTILGTFVKALPETRGEGQRGPWVRGGFVVQYGGEYIKTLALTCFGEERVAAVKGIASGQQVLVSFNPESREYNGRWYTECHCMSVQPVGGQQPQLGQPAPTAQQQTMAAAPTAQQPIAQPVAAAYNPLQPEPDLPF